MAAAFVEIAGNPDESVRLSEALADLGVAARFQPAASLTEAFVEMEHRLESGAVPAAVAVGASREALALAVSAGKLGIPLATVPIPNPQDDDRARALATLTWLDAGDSVGPAATHIAAWLREGPEAKNLDSAQ